MNEPQTPPRATLFIASQCPHCPTVLQGMGELIKQGKLRELQVFNIEQATEEASHRGIRSVPWIEIGPFQLTGLHSPQELAHWTERASSPHGFADYLVELITHSQLPEAQAFLTRDSDHLRGIIELLADPATELSIRIGAGALVEELATTDSMALLVPGLIRLTHHQDARIRGDAAHYLSMSHEAVVASELQRLLEDPDAEVRDIAREGLESLAENGVLNSDHTPL